MALARLGATSLDCDDPVALGTFYAELLEAEVIFSSDNFVAVKADGGILTMQKIEEHVAPTWPNAGQAKQIHLDLGTDDLPAAVAEAIRLGAVETEEQPSPDRWRVLLDPAGHPFCLSTLLPKDL